MLNSKFLYLLVITFNGVWLISGRLSTGHVIGYQYEDLKRSEVSKSEEDLQGRENIKESAELSSILDGTWMKAKSPYFDIRLTLPSNCAEATARTKHSGIYIIKSPKSPNDIVLVECDAQTDGGDWMVIQKRQDGSVDFYRTWSEYKHGFGNIVTEYFLGLDQIVAVTNVYGPQELLILMEDNTANTTYAKYSSFLIGNETEMYKLKSIGSYSGTAGDSLKYHIGMKFTTKDRDNDEYTRNCAVFSWGAWWYKSCYESNLNGRYGPTGFDEKINWNSFTANVRHLISVKMMIRSRRL